MLSIRLASETGVYFDWDKFSELVMAGKWDKMEKILNRYLKYEIATAEKNTIRIYFEIRKQKYLEYLVQYLRRVNSCQNGLMYSRHDYDAAAKMLHGDLVEFKLVAPDVYNDLVYLFAYKDPRFTEQMYNSSF